MGGHVPITRRNITSQISLLDEKLQSKWLKHRNVHLRYIKVQLHSKTLLSGYVVKREFLVPLKHGVGSRVHCKDHCY